VACNCQSLKLNRHTSLYGLRVILTCGKWETCSHFSHKIGGVMVVVNITAILVLLKLKLFFLFGVAHSAAESNFQLNCIVLWSAISVVLIGFISTHSKLSQSYILSKFFPPVKILFSSLSVCCWRRWENFSVVKFPKLVKVRRSEDRNYVFPANYCFCTSYYFSCINFIKKNEAFLFFHFHQNDMSLIWDKSKKCKSFPLFNGTKLTVKKGGE